MWRLGLALYIPCDHASDTAEKSRTHGSVLFFSGNHGYSTFSSKTLEANENIFAAWTGERNADATVWLSQDNPTALLRGKSTGLTGLPMLGCHIVFASY